MKMKEITKTTIEGIKTVYNDPDGKKGMTLLGVEIASLLVSASAKKRGNTKMGAIAFVGSLASFAASQYYLQKASDNMFNAYLDSLHFEVDIPTKATTDTSDEGSTME